MIKAYLLLMNPLLNISVICCSESVVVVFPVVFLRINLMSVSCAAIDQSDGHLETDVYLLGV